MDVITWAQIKNIYKWNHTVYWLYDGIAQLISVSVFAKNNSLARVSHRLSFVGI